MRLSLSTAKRNLRNTAVVVEMAILFWYGLGGNCAVTVDYLAQVEGSAMSILKIEINKSCI